MEMKLKELSKFCMSIEGGEECLLRGVAIDSRKIQANELYVALKGENFDGHDFVMQAIEKGACAVVVNKDYCSKQTMSVPLVRVENTREALGKIATLWRQKFTIPVVGITGSCGKTTTKSMLSHILSTCQEVLFNQGNYNNEIGLPLTLFRLNEKHEACVLEMGARFPKDIEYLMQIANPNVALITNAEHVHLEKFETLDQVVKTKGEIYANLSLEGTAVLSFDSPYYDYWRNLVSDQKQISFGFSEKADVFAANVQILPTNTLCTFQTPKGAIDIFLSVPGKHNVFNALAASACAVALDVDLVQIQKGLATYKPVSGRLETKTGRQGALILDDTYNAAPVSMRAALAVLKTQPQQKKIFVVGDMAELGSSAKQWHVDLGKEAKASGVTILYAVGLLTQHTVSSFGEDAWHFKDKKALLKRLKSELDDATVVLVKGSRSARMEEVVEALEKDAC